MILPVVYKGVILYFGLQQEYKYLRLLVEILVFFSLTCRHTSLNSYGLEIIMLTLLQPSVFDRQPFSLAC